MAAQRLIAILIALLVVSTMLALLAPAPTPDEEETTTTTDSIEAEITAPEAETIERRFEIEPDRRTLELDANVGDRLELTVASPELRQVRVDPLGLLQTADRAAPARFDILLTEAGKVSITSPDLADPVATFKVTEPDSEAAGTRGNSRGSDSESGSGPAASSDPSGQRREGSRSEPDAGEAGPVPDPDINE